MGKFIYAVHLKMDVDTIDVTTLGEEDNFGDFVRKDLHLYVSTSQRDHALKLVNAFFDEFEKL